VLACASCEALLRCSAPDSWATYGALSMIFYSSDNSCSAKPVEGDEKTTIFSVLNTVGAILIIDGSTISTNVLK
jgi:hypothetical protein